MKLLKVFLILLLFGCLVWGKGREGECCRSMRCNYQTCNSGLFCKKKDPSGQFWWMGGVCKKDQSSGCKCGLVQRRSRVVGGTETEVNEYPWMVLTFHFETKWCGGSLISNRWVLSAAHCFMKDTSITRAYKARLGEHDITRQDESNHIDIYISRIMNHPQFVFISDVDNWQLQFDYSLLRLEEEVDFSIHQHIRPICLPNADDSTFDNVVATATGWGRTEHSMSSDQLLEVDLNVMSNNACRRNYHGEIKEQELCANVKGEDKSVYQGDSGGPLITRVSDGPNFQQIGISSYISCEVENCTVPNLSVFARVTKQLTWISETTDGLHGSCPM